MKVVIQRVYQHFKGGYCFVLDIAKCSETGKEYVVYKCLSGKCETFIRPVEMFCEEVDSDREDNITGQSSRFKLVEEMK